MIHNYKLSFKRIFTTIMVLLFVLNPMKVEASNNVDTSSLTIQIKNPVKDIIVTENDILNIEATVSDISKVEKVVFYEWKKGGMQSREVGVDTTYPYATSFVPFYAENMEGYRINYISAKVITKDKKEVTTEYLRFYVFGNGVQIEKPQLSVANWKDDKVAAYTPTYDDNWLITSHKRVNELHKTNIVTGESRSIKGTLFWDSAGANWYDLNRCILGDNLLDIGAHTVTHSEAFPTFSEKDRNDQLANSQMDIYKNLGKLPLTHAYPYYALNDAIEKDTSKYYIAARWGSNDGNILTGEKVKVDDLAIGINDYNTKDYYRIKSMCPEKSTPASTFDKWLDQTIENGGWIVTSMHGVASLHPYSWKSQLDEALNDHYDYVQKKINEGLVWNDTFENVSLYLRERNVAKLEQIATPNVYQFRYRLVVEDKNLATNLQSYLNYPLTLKFRVPKNWIYVSATQGRNKLDVKMKCDSNGMYVIFDAYPQGGDIVIVRGNS